MTIGNDKTADKLSIILASIIKKQKSSAELEEERERILKEIEKYLSNEKPLSRDVLLNYADILSMIAEWERSEKKLTKHVETSLLAMLVYSLLNDAKKDELYQKITKRLQELEKEALTWKNWDRAFLYRVLSILAEIISRNAKPQLTVTYLSKVYPTIRDFPSTIIEGLFCEKTSKDVENKFNTYKEFANKNNLDNIFKIIVRMYGLTKLYLRMKGAISDSNDENAEC